MYPHQKVAQSIFAALHKKSFPKVIIDFPRYKSDHQLCESAPDIDGWADNELRNANTKESLDQLEKHVIKLEDYPHLFRYTANSSDINNALYVASKNGVTHPDFIDNREISEFRIRHDIKALDAAVSRNKLKHPLVTYSGITWNPADQMTHDGLVHTPAFSSTSTDPHLAYGFSFKKDAPKNHDRHILRIRHQVGQSGVYLKNDPEITQYDHESEYIIPRDSVLKVNKTPTVLHDKIRGDSKVFIWDAERVHTPNYDTKYVTPHQHRLIRSDPATGATMSAIHTLTALTEHAPEFTDVIPIKKIQDAHIRGDVLHIKDSAKGDLIGTKDYNGYTFHKQNGVPFSVDKVKSRYPAFANHIDSQ